VRSESQRDWGWRRKSFPLVAEMAVDCMSWCLHGTSASEALLLLSTSASSIDTLLDIELEIEIDMLFETSGVCPFRATSAHSNSMVTK